MLLRTKNWPMLAVPMVLGALLSATPLFAAEPGKVVTPTDAKICQTCHKPEAGNLRGNWEGVAMKSSSIQLKIDNHSEVIKFDKANVQVLNTTEKSDVEKQLRSIKKGHEVRIEFTEKDGAKYAKVVASKPPIKLTEQEKIGLPEVEKLVAIGPEKGNYILIDSRPGLRFKEGAIPTAISLPFPEFDKLVDRLPADKNRLTIFYCSGVTCNMSPSSQKAAKKLGYTNIKVFVEGMPGWFSNNYGVVGAQAVQDAYKDIPYVLLDARPAAVAEKGFIKGAMTFTSADEKALKVLPKKEMKAPIIVYDQDGKGNAIKVATAIVKAGYSNVLVMNGGLAAWQNAKLSVETGKLASKVTYVPKPKPGEIPMDQFVKMLDAIPADTILLDVRNADELKDGLIKGSVNIPATDIDHRYSELPKDKKIIAYCNTGTRAEMSYLTLKAKGFTNIFFLNAKVDYDDGKPEVTK